MRNNWSKFCRLGWLEQSVLLQAMVLLPLMALGIRILGLHRIQAVLAWLAPLAGGRAEIEGEGIWQQADMIARLVTVAAWHGPYSPNCLQRSLTLWWLLRRRAIPSDLYIGVRKRANQFEAHAWVEHENRVLNDATDIRRQFISFDRPIGLIGERSL